MRRSVFALCVLAGAVIGAAAPSAAEARNCTDRAFIVIKREQQAAIPKTRRVKRLAKLQPALTAHVRSPSPKKPAQNLSVVRTADLHAVDRTGPLDTLEELELELFGFDLVLDDPQRVAPGRLRPRSSALRHTSLDDLAPRLSACTGVRSRADVLRARMLPKIPASGDDSSLG